MDETQLTLNTGRAERSLGKLFETGALVLLVLWCLLPAGMCVYDTVMGALGKFPIPDDFNERWGAVVFREAVMAYIYATRVLGSLSCVWALMAVLLCVKRVLNPRELRSKPWFFLFFLMIVWAGVCMARAEDPTAAFLGEFNQYNGFSNLLIYGGVFLCASMIRREEARRRLLQLFSAVTVVLAALMLVQDAGNDLLYRCFPSQHAMVFNQFNHFGYVLCMAILACVGLYLQDGGGTKWTRAAELAAIGLLTHALRVNDTLGAMVAAAAAIPFAYLFCWRKGGGRSLHVFFPALAFGLMAVKTPLWLLAVVPICSLALSSRELRVQPKKIALLLVILLLLAGALLAFAPQAQPVRANLRLMWNDFIKLVTGAKGAEHAGNDRGMLWKGSVEVIRENPVFGIGPDGFVIYELLKQNQNPHNELLMVAGTIGLPGLALYLGMLLTLAWVQFGRLRKLEPMVTAAAGVTIAYLVSSMFGNPVFNTAPFFWLFLGLSTAGFGEDAILLDADAPELAEGRKRGRVIAFAAVYLAGCAALFFFGIRAFRTNVIPTELQREWSDLTQMLTADVYLRTLGEEDWEEGGVYWFDPETRSFIPDGEPLPTWRGSGTRHATLAPVAFEQRAGHYDYDAKTNYCDKLLCVRCVDTPEGHRFLLEWASPDE